MDKESAEAYGLAGIGAVEGVYKYYIQPELTERSSLLRSQLKASRMWLGIAAGVTAYELLCPDGELLSEGADRGIEKHPLLVPLAIGITALHLANILPPRIDPLTLGLKALKRL